MNPIRFESPPARPSNVASLSELDLERAVDWATQRGLPAYRGRQLYAALTHRAVQDIREVTEFPAALRDELSKEFLTRSLGVRVHLTSRLDGSEKVLFELPDGATVESVLIHGRNAAGPRETVCVSSQIGCPAACTFCATGLGGFTRNLSPSEIVDQVMYFQHRLLDRGRRVTNVVFMGMGEPFLNVRSVRDAVRQLIDPEGINLGARHITVSTVGIVPQVRAFASWAGQVNLAVSIHAPNDELRSQLVPYNRHFPIGDLMEAVRDYVDVSGRRVSFEYVLLRGVNDDVDLAVQLARIIRPLGGMAHVNLIPWNPFREGRFVRSEGPDADRFACRLREEGINVTIRYSKGIDISAACGQLRERAEAT